jgi:hypothetical protein
MNETPKARSAVIKVLAIVGFLATITIGVWVMVQVARVLPDTFSSLASIANSINSYRPGEELTVVTERSIINSGDLFTISWSELEQSGTYTFSYACTDGISLDVRTGTGAFVPVTCGETRSLPEGAHTLEVRVASEKRRFSDIPFTIAFTDADTDETTERMSKVTIVNATIPLSADVAVEETDEEETADESPADVADGNDDTPTPVPPSPGGSASTPTTPAEQVVSIMPQSHEDGFTDLSIRYLGIGELVDDSFVARATIDTDARGALKFEVKNIGTKTSGNWTFEVTLPSGVEFESDKQVPLKPNERVEFTMGFDPQGETGVASVSGEVFEDADTNSRNDRFTWSVEVTD